MNDPPTCTREQIRIMAKSRLGWLERLLTFRSPLRALQQILGAQEQVIELMPARLDFPDAGRQHRPTVLFVLTMQRVVVLFPFRTAHIIIIEGHRITSIGDDMPLERSLTLYYLGPEGDGDNAHHLVIRYDPEHMVCAARVAFLGSILAIHECWNNVEEMERTARHYEREGLNIPYILQQQSDRTS